MGDVIPLYGSTTAEVKDRPLAEARAHYVNCIEDAWSLLRWLSERGRDEIALDTETTGLDRQRDKIRLCQVGDEMDGWAIPYERWSGVVADIVNRYHGRYIMHNSPFDWTMLANDKIVIRTDKIDDTRIMAHVLTSTGPLGLKPLSQLHVDPAAASAEEALKTGIGTHGGWSWATVPTDFEPYWVYGALDTVLTKRLKNFMWPKIVADNCQLSYELEMAVTWVCVRMEMKGARVDAVYTQDLLEKLTKYCVDVDRWCRDNYHVSPGSDEIANVLLREGVQLIKKTPANKWCLDKDVLGSIDHPLAQAVLQRRQLQKVTSTYLTHYLNLRDGEDRIHPNINVIGGSAKNPFESGGERGVRTGRMSMNDPNLQNVPVRTAMGKKIRNCFIPQDGNIWIKCDADQIEMRIFAHIARDPALIDAFVQARRGGPDMFTRACREIFQDDTITKEDVRRQFVKNGFYAILYGAGTEQFAKTAGMWKPERNQYGDRMVDLTSASKFLQALHARYPGIHQLQSLIESEARQRRQVTGEAFVRSPLTRRRHTADRGREYALMNYMVQGAAGEILKMKLIEADHAGLGDFMMFPVHDEIDLDVPKDDLQEVLHTLQEVMNDDKLLDVPITWTSDVGPRWGECS